MKVPPSGIGWSIQECDAARTSRNKRKERRKVAPVRSAGEENSPTISIESDTTGLGGDDRFDRDDETVREDVVSEGIGEVGNRGRFVNSAADAMPPSSRTTWNPHRRTSRST